MFFHFMSHDNEITHSQILQKKAEMFYRNKIKVHLRLKSGSWERGMIIGEPNEDAFILRLTEEGIKKSRGASQKIFFYLELDSIDEYQEVSI